MTSFDRSGSAVGSISETKILTSFRWDIPFELPISFLATLLDRQAHLANVQLEHAGTATFEGLRDRIIEAHAIRHSLVKLFIADAACWDTSFASHLFTCCNISRLRVEVPYAPTNASRDALFELDNAGNLQTDHFGEELFKSWMHLPAGVTAPVKLNLTSLYLERVHLELCKDTWAQAVELRSLTSLYLFHCPHAEMFTWALTRGRAVAEVPLLRTLDITNHELDSLDADNMIIALNTYLE